MFNTRNSHLLIYFLLLSPVLAAARNVRRLNSSNSDPFVHDKELSHHDDWRRKPEKLGEWKLAGPEDVLYDPVLNAIYTGCRNGWIMRLHLADSPLDVEVEKWVHTGGRPLGLAWVPGTNQMIVADAHRGLLKIEGNGEIKELSKEVNGEKFKITDGVVVANDGIIYFTDASSKYSIEQFMLDVFSGTPYGRLLSYDPNTSTTNLLASGLFFPNGLAISPSQDFLVFCETPKRRCQKYNLKGERKGRIEPFVDLPGMPDNVHFADGYFWIAAATLPEPTEKKGKKIAEKEGELKGERGRVHVVELEGKVWKVFSDNSLRFANSALKIGDFMYCGSIIYPHIVRFPLSE